jgi:hypothetical protein
MWYTSCWGPGYSASHRATHCEDNATIPNAPIPRQCAPSSENCKALPLNLMPPGTANALYEAEFCSGPHRRPVTMFHGALPQHREQQRITSNKTLLPSDETAYRSGRAELKVGWLWHALPRALPAAQVGNRKTPPVSPG